MTSINRRPATNEQLKFETSTWPGRDARAWQEAHDPILGRLSWAPESRYTYGRVYTRYLAAARKANALDDNCSLNQPGLSSFVAEAEQTASLRTLHGYVHQLIEVATVIYPDAIREGHFAWLYETRANFKAAAQRTPKQRHDKLVSALDLLWVADTALKEAPSLPGWIGVQRYRDGLFLLLGLYVPERRRALASLKLDQIDIENETLFFHPDQIKMRDRHDWSLSSGIREVLQTWIEDWRAAHAKAGHTALFIGKGGNPAGDGALYTALCKLTKTKLGKSISPHLLRHASATTLLETEPGTPDLVSRLLYHRNPQTKAEYTERANSILAGQKLQASIATSREKARKDVLAQRSTSRLAQEEPRLQEFR